MKRLILILTIAFNIYSGYAQQKVVVDASRPIAKIQPTMWGLFFEDINFAADGGLYAELVKNRSFEFDEPMMGWELTAYNDSIGRIFIFRDETKTNAHYIRLQCNVDNTDFGVVNEGFRGIGLRAGNPYDFSILARSIQNGNARLNIRLLNHDGKTLAQTEITVNSGEWKKYSAALTPASTEEKASLSVALQGKSTVDIDMVSLFPRDTWKNRPNVLRKDLVQMLADMKPGFIRFPGGCIVEGRTLLSRYQWKNTVGNPADRKLIINRWNTEFKNRLTPDYYQSYGLGFFEYFLLAEDIGAEPLPVMNCGMACQFNTSELAPMENLDPYVQDVLDLIEFANGDTTSEWGKLRASMGHPAPFHLKMVGIGNEQWGPQYFERYKVFAEAIHRKYPGIRLVSGAGPFPGGEDFNYAWKQLRHLNADLVDEHYYSSPKWFLQNATRYDSYDRKGPKVFAGEYAAHDPRAKAPELKNNWEASLAEAAFMTGLERNADVVFMASYAPLFANAEAWQWTPDLIWFNGLAAFGTPNYYVQKMFSSNRGTEVLPALSNGKPIAGQDSLYISACIDSSTDKGSEEIILKMVNVSSRPAHLDITLNGVKRTDNKAMLEVLSSGDPLAVNSFSTPTAIAPVDKTMDTKGRSIEIILDANSLTLLKVHCKR